MGKKKYLITDRKIWRSVIKKLTPATAEELRNRGFWVEEL